jgi:hypothetical protein
MTNHGVPWCIVHFEKEINVRLNNRKTVDAVVASLMIMSDLWMMCDLPLRRRGGGQRTNKSSLVE